MFSTILLAASAAFAPVDLAAGDVPKLDSAQAQLEHAKKVKSESRGTKGAARIDALELAAEAFGAVAEYWPAAGAVTSEAAFRRGEINRTLGRPGIARGAFQEAFDSGKGTPFAARSLVEMGHLHRRAAEMKKALDSYQRVHGLEGVALRYRNDAREWSGKVHLALENWKDAAAAFAEWAANAEGPVEVVRAADLEAKAWIGAGELDKAGMRIKQVRMDYESLAGEPTKEAESLRKALERMSAPDELVQARKAAEAVAAR